MDIFTFFETPYGVGNSCTVLSSCVTRCAKLGATGSHITRKKLHEIDMMKIEKYVEQTHVTDTNATNRDA
ncbi:hypothetical protein POVWA2_040930 [Plasmodium ovale wallikeri]|uniref:Uncharacterized protein n=1 Tax=Plasmodium ovale wallikeri TaxID=864142 RepID=A0A1A8Z9U8_PLAOA|nr:hypothetical protein POVWA1_042430 [Plasmodium ovale wallikeri]SBT40981.1 hypothetical protein POVWA2_040930 [Plasmodium ovale wallikeri]